MNRYIALKKILDTGSFTKAAEALNCTQSAVSQMISSLETELSMKLLLRSRGTVRLTAEGEELYPFIERLVNQWQAVEEKAKEIRGLESGVIRVGTLTSITCHWMPKLIKGFQEEYPGAQFLFHSGDYTLIPGWINDGSVDFGFITPKVAPALKHQKVKDGELLAVLPLGHPYAEKEKVPLSALAEEPFILLEEGQYSEILSAFEDQGLRPRIKYTVHDDFAIMTMVESGLGVSVLAELMLLRTDFQIAKVHIDPPIRRSLSIAYRDWDSLPIASKRFIEYLMDMRDELP